MCCLSPSCATAAPPDWAGDTPCPRPPAQLLRRDRKAHLLLPNPTPWPRLPQAPPTGNRLSSPTGPLTRDTQAAPRQAECSGRAREPASGLLGPRPPVPWMSRRGSHHEQPLPLTPQPSATPQVWLRPPGTAHARFYQSHLPDPTYQ